jgi:hypothetical protein
MKKFYLAIGMRNLHRVETLGAPAIFQVDAIQGQSLLTGLEQRKGFATFDSNATPFWLGSYRVQPDNAVLHREMLWDQLIPRCCIDRLSWHD